MEWIAVAELLHDGATFDRALCYRRSRFELGLDPHAGATQVRRQRQVQRAIRIGIKNRHDCANRRTITRQIDPRKPDSDF
jgi:hypothetical protein